MCQLNPIVAQKPGIQVFNVDRELAGPGAQRAVIKGDTDGVGFQAGPDKGLSVMQNALQAQPTIDAVYDNPSMAASAVALARLLGRNEGLSDLVEPVIPSLIVMPAQGVFRENVAPHTAFDV